MNADQARVTERLERFPAELASVARLAAGRTVARGEWTAREVVLHLVAVEEEVFQRRLGQLATEDHPGWPWVEPGLWNGPGDEALDGALAAFADLRAATVARLCALDDAGWARSGTHAVFGVLDLAGLLRIAVDHDAEHLAQIAG